MLQSWCEDRREEEDIKNKGCLIYRATRQEEMRKTTEKIHVYSEVRYWFDRRRCCGQGEMETDGLLWSHLKGAVKEEVLSVVKTVYNQLRLNETGLLSVLSGYGLQVS